MGVFATAMISMASSNAKMLYELSKHKRPVNRNPLSDDAIEIEVEIISDFPLKENQTKQIELTTMSNEENQGCCGECNKDAEGIYESAVPSTTTDSAAPEEKTEGGEGEIPETSEEAAPEAIPA